ncbi:MAG TPA: ABC transporter ATP-binding protein, partial [Planctomycetota bacterium]|nr:ABC transporter ATP-binding protein [Planctomycetota bacterium]
MFGTRERRRKREEEMAEIGDEFVVAAAWDGRLVRRLVLEARPHAKLFARTFGVLAILFAFELAGPWVVRAAIDGPVASALEERATAGAAFESGPYLRDLALWGLLYLAFALGMVVFRYLEVASLTHTGQTVVADLRTRVFRHIQGLDLAWFDRTPTGSLVTRVTSDVESLNEMFTSGLVELFFDILRIAAVLAVLYVLHWQLALVVTLGLPILIGISLVFRGGARDAHRVVRARLSRLNGYLQEVLSGIRVVQVFRNERKVSGRFAGLLGEYLSANVRTILLFALFFPCLDLAVNGIQASTLWVGGVDIAGGTLTVGAFFQFWMYLGLLLDPVRELGERYNVLQSAFASAERIFQVLDTRGKVRAPTAVDARRIDPAGFRGHVRFEHVDFG